MRTTPLVLSALLVAACSSPSSGSPGDASPGTDASVDAAPVTTTVTLFSAEPMSFTGSANHRTADRAATFPTGPFAHVTLHVTLACPQSRCDVWDRRGSLALLDAAPVPDGGTVASYEFARFVTPYGVGGSWDTDVTDLQPLFTGTRTARAFVDTWVGPGSSSGNGWLLTATLTFESGRPARLPVSVVPLGWERATYGDPMHTVASQLVPKTVDVPAGTGGASVFVLTTGHGQGNLENCAEFCPRTHTLRIDGATRTQRIWRDDCDQNPIANQRGTWEAQRAGWCPGSMVAPWIEDVGILLTPGASHTVGYDVQTYVNSCRPDATTCAGCALRTPCAYDDGNHTEPFYQVTGYVVLYAP